MAEDYWLSALLIISGAAMVLTAERQAKTAQRRMESGKDTYFEERRELAIYPSLHKASAIRRSGWMMIACSVAVGAIQMFAGS